MGKRFFLLNFFFSVLLMTCAFDARSQHLKVIVAGIKFPKGVIMLNIFKDNESFKKEQPFKKIKFSKQGLASQQIVLECMLEPGIYGVTMIDDENANEELDKSMLGKPKEGFGFSGFYLEKMKRPLFDEFKFEVKKGDNSIGIKVKYM